MLDPLEKYQRDSRKTIDQFLRREMAPTECIWALAAALASAKQSIKADRILLLADMALADNARVMGEMEKRQNKRKAEARYRANGIKKLAAQN
jgi:hypothetical protein